MNRREIERLIPIAIKAIRNNPKIYNSEKKAVPNEFAGYVNSFAVSITLSGVYQAIIFYSQEKKENKPKFHRNEMIFEIRKMMKKIPKGETLQIYLEKAPVTADFKEELLDATIAFKTALQVFKLEKEMELW